MSKSVFCVKLQEEAESMNSAPFPGELGQRILNEVSQKAWNMWLNHQTMLINEYRLNLADPSSRQFLQTEMQKYFFGEGSEKPKGFVDPNIEKP